MQAKVRKVTLDNATWDPEFVRTGLGFTGGISLNDAATFNPISNSRRIDISRGVGTRLECLALLGGRESIKELLRTAGNDPVICNTGGDAGGGAYVYVARKHRVFDKDLTLVLVAPHGGLTCRSNWSVVAPVNVTNTPEARVSPITGNRLPELTPQGLRSLLDRKFAQIRMAA